MRQNGYLMIPGNARSTPLHPFNRLESAPLNATQGSACRAATNGPSRANGERRHYHVHNDPEMIETLTGVRELLRRSTENAQPLDAPTAYVMIAAVNAVTSELEERW